MGIDDDQVTQEAFLPVDRQKSEMSGLERAVYEDTVGVHFRARLLSQHETTFPIPYK